MLIESSRVLQESRDPILNLLASGKKAGKLDVGIYEVHHFGSSHFLRDGFEQYPELEREAVHPDEGLYFGCYGVCDNAQQILDACPMLVTSERKFVITLTPVLRSEQSDWGGWRWHKWGEYIGTQNPQHEYLYDDTHIDKVYCYHIYEAL